MKKTIILFLLSSVLCTAAERPNIIFIIADDMQRYMFNCLEEGKGRNLTPHIDQLAAEGTLLMGQHVASPVCTPSRYTCLTGLYASRSQHPAMTGQTKREGQSVVQWNSFVTSENTLPKRLQKAGYSTGFVGKNHFVKSGAEHVDYQADPHHADVIDALKRRQAQSEAAIKAIGFDYTASVYEENPDHNGPKKLAVHNIDWTTQGALNFLDQHKADPFFLYYATTIPHGPGEKDRSWNADPRIIPTGYLDEAPTVQPARNTIPKRLRQAKLPVDSGRANMLWFDDSIGAIMQRLHDHGLEKTPLSGFSTTTVRRQKVRCIKAAFRTPASSGARVDSPAVK